MSEENENPPMSKKTVSSERPEGAPTMDIAQLKEMNISALAELVGVTESAVSHHMRGLRQMRLVRARKAGRQVFYCLDDDHVAALFRQGLDHVRHG